jgi:pullulanase
MNTNHTALRTRPVLILCLLAAVEAPAVARSLDAPARRLVRDGEKMRVVVKTQSRVLPAESFEGKRVEVQEGAKSLVKRVSVDSPVQNGKFTRTIKTVTLVSKTAGAAPWARSENDFAPKWSKKDAKSLYTSKQLGPIYDQGKGSRGGSVTVRLHAPEAREVYVVLDGSNERFRLAPDRTGVWSTKLDRAPSALYGKTYHYEVDGKTVSDPYSHLVAGDYGPSVFADLRFDWHDQGYDKGSVTKKLQARGVSEVHVKDMTAHPSAPVENAAERGTYLGLKAPGVLAHYKELGVGAAELLPVHQFDVASGDRANGQPTVNHWGYNTTHYLAVHRQWAYKPGEAHRELQSAVDALHRQGTSVVMDVVFNHTAQGPTINFNVLGKSLFYRLKPDGSYYNGAGCVNEVASEKPMVRKLIVASLREFVEKYHIDGFRLDLGSLLDKKTMATIDRALPKRVFLTAEPWAAEWDRAKWGKGDNHKTRFTYWNDDFRNAAWGFLSGAGGDETRNKMMNAVAGSVAGYGQGWASRPTQSLNYIESHDEKSLSDRVGGDKRRAFLGNVLLLTSQGIPMLGHGQEFMRSKKGISNAHNLDNDVSHVDWSLKGTNRDFFDATKGLLGLRAKLPHFHYDRPLTDKDITWLTPPNSNALGYLLRAPQGTPGRKAMPEVLVLTNSDAHSAVTFTLPRAGEWRVLVDGHSLQVSEAGLRNASGTYSVPAGSAVILSQVPPAR